MEDYEIEDMIPESMIGEDRGKLKKFLKKTIRRESIAKFLAGVTIGALATLASTLVYTILNDKNQVTIRKTDYVEEGYVIPSRLEEISVENLDLTGKPETTLRYDGKDYLFKVNKEGIPICVPYEIEHIPPKIIIPKITKLL